jgi:beta-lactamase class A
MRALLLGSVLSSASRQQLAAALIASQTGLARLRAGLPRGFRAGDKTGTGANGAVNDVAIVWPAQRAPWLIAVYTSGSKRPLAELNTAHAEVAALIADAWS